LFGDKGKIRGRKGKHNCREILRKKKRSANWGTVNNYVLLMPSTGGGENSYKRPPPTNLPLGVTKKRLRGGVPSQTLEEKNLGNNGGKE